MVEELFHAYGIVVTVVLDYIMLPSVYRIRIKICAFVVGIILFCFLFACLCSQLDLLSKNFQ